MQITDLNGDVITITDLTTAIEQAKNFMEYRHKNKAFKTLDEQLRCYWTDMYNKLLQLHKNLITTK